uniref:Uncharacterized protein n=1 Tax=Spermophilus dauricus TaxID=99837 RepID=A0A8C9QNJ4_SPEDA
MKTKTGLTADIGLFCSLCFLFPLSLKIPTPIFFFVLSSPHPFLFTLSSMALLVAFQVRKLFRKVSLCICTR